MWKTQNGSLIASTGERKSENAWRSEMKENDERKQSER